MMQPLGPSIRSLQILLSAMLFQSGAALLYLLIEFKTMLGLFI
jgi:hypothetical protein